MTNDKVAHRLITWFILSFISSLILHVSVLDNQAVVADLDVVPLWNATNVTDSCLLTVDNYEVLRLSGHPLHTCGVQLTPSNVTIALLQVPQGVFLYAERQGYIPNCQKRYISIKANESCIFLFQYTQLRLFLPGYNRTVLISGIHTNRSVSTCPGQPHQHEQHVFRVSQTKPCKIEEFNHLISCDLTSDNTCSIKFPTNCYSTLDERVVEFQCNTDNVYSSYKALMVLPTNVICLDLSSHGIMTLQGSPFISLVILQELILDRNRLSYLDPQVLSDLHTLKYLSLEWNKLIFLDDGTFKSLTALTKLSLVGNYLSKLPTGIFHGLANLSELYMDNNRLTILKNETLIGLKELKVFSIRQNELRVLPESTFSDTVYLKKIDLDGNKLGDLTTLPESLFLGLINLKVLNLELNAIISFDENLFRGLINLEYLYLEKNKINSLDENLFNETRMLRELHIPFNSLTYLLNNVFRGLHDLKLLSIYENPLLSVPYDLFWGLKNVHRLDLGATKIKSVNGQIFYDLKNLQQLYFDKNPIKKLPFNLFQETTNLRMIDMSGNMLSDIPDMTNLKELFFLNLKDNNLINIGKQTFSILPKHFELIVSQHEICECFVSEEIDCTAADDRSPFLTCDRLLSDRGLVVVMWLIGLNALGGNIFVLCQRKSKTDKNKIQTFLLSNLALSDLLMGVYMLLIASTDIYFGERFPMQAERWRSGITCRIAGAISIISSEASVFFVTFISIDRFINIKYPLSRRILTMKSSAVVVVILWITSLTLGVVSSTLAGQNDRFYTNSHVCIGLPLAKLPVLHQTHHFDWISECSDGLCFWTQPVETKFLGEVNGMIFASVIFLGLNFLCYLVILMCYVEIVRAYFQSSKRVGLNPEMKEQIRLTRKVAAIILTDFACWFPIILLGILVQVDVLTLPADVFAWCVTFVLPINSAINPYLYTIANVISKRREKSQSNDLQNDSHKSNRPGKAVKISNKSNLELSVISSK